MFGPVEILVVVLIVLLVFGAGRLPRMGRQLGSGLREFKDGLTKRTDAHFADDDDGGGRRRAIGDGTPVDDGAVRDQR